MASSSAQAAAALAFLNPQVSNTSLSAAAAAAALRARPTTPTSVADVQTKRTMRRTNSNSSIGSSVSGSTRGPPGAQLERRGSSGSMTERTFREPSPTRGSARPSLDNAPPVPAIPKNLAPAVPTQSHTRAASMETPILPRIASPLPNPATGRGSSLEPYRGNQAPTRPAQKMSSLSRVQELTGIERPNSRGSVNFSYPRGFRQMAPYGQRQLTSPTPSSLSQRSAPRQKQNLVYDPNTRTFMPEAELLFIEQSIQDASERPVRRKKKVSPQGATGTHLSDGTVGGRIHGTAVKATSTGDDKSKLEKEPLISPQASNITAPRKKKKKPPISDSSYELESDTQSAPDYESDSSEKPLKLNTRAGMSLAKKPSIVREDREREEAEDDASKASDRQAALTKLESRSSEVRPVSPTLLPNAVMGHGRGLASASATAEQNQQHTGTAGQPTPTFSTETTATSSLIPTILDAVEGDDAVSKPVRVQSLSPVRNAHFLTTPESLAVRHQPPARSISPRKSALKHSPSSRGSSPNGEAQVGSTTNRVSSLSETSDTSTALSDERNPPKKKSVRVSFDDDSNIVLGQADRPVASDTPVIQSPQGKRGWFGGMGRGKMKELADLDDNEDEIMKPRPALPSFGSVREKKPRDADERPLVKPTESSEPAAPIPSPLFTTATGVAIQHPLGQSSDHAVGSVLAQDQASKNAANISKFREPLPPEVTSVEGSGDISDSSSVGTTEHIIESTHAIEQKPEAQQAAKIEETSEESPADFSESSLLSLSALSREEPEVHSAKSNGNGTIPSLALTKASPTLEETKREAQFPYIIGGFPSSSESGLDDIQDSIFENQPTDPNASAVGIAQPEPIVHSSGSSATGKITAQNLLHHPAAADEDTEESDNNSVYSDAAEDLSDMQGDGFMSLDAVVESPIVPKIPGLAITTLPESPTTRASKENPYVKSSLTEEQSEPEKDEGWEKAQEYWSGLTTEKKKELERAAREESSESSEEEVIPESSQKTKKVVVKSPPSSPQIDQPKVDYFHNRTYQIIPGAKAGLHDPVPVMRSSMRSSMRGAHPKTEEGIHMRSSMRTPPTSEESVHMRKSMRESGSLRGSMRETFEPSASSSQAKGSLQKKYRPMSVPQPEIKSSPVEAKKHVKSMSTSSAPTAAPTKLTPTLRRKGSAESDSSFKRARPATEGYSMKRSMRGPQPQQAFARHQLPELPASTVRSSRFSLRSLSPTGSVQRDAPPVGLGRTLRNNRPFSTELTVPTLRSPAPDNTKSRFPGFGKSKSQPKVKSTPTRASRFADSSDEEDTRPAFRSRFVDSDDEEDDIVTIPAATRAPIALGSITRSKNTMDDDSSDLPDTDDEKPSKPAKATKVALPPPTHAGTALASGSLRRSGSGRDFIGAKTITSISAAARPNQKRRGSFMSSILRRKKLDPGSKVQKLEGESGARRDTPLERTPADLRAVRQDSNFLTAGGTANPKLQKRSAAKKTETSETLEDWPLASPHPDTNSVEPDDERPHTSDGAELSEKQLENGTGPLASAKPDLGPRRTTATGLEAVDLSPVVPPKRKKKFGILRRAFGLDD
jgi:serine/arginine repetitive matrix protein 2